MQFGTMKIYPTIEIMGGRAVNRVDGRHETPEPFDLSPEDAARRFADAGADCLHVVDVDGALQGGRHNAGQICRLIDSVTIPVQVAGGIRSIGSVHWWFEHGAWRVGLGTAAVKDRNLVTDACTAYPDRIIATVAARNGMVVIEGWREETAFEATEMAVSLVAAGISEIVFIDLDRDKEPRDYSLARTMRMGEALDVPVISSGTVTSIDDVSMLKYLPNIGGCIIGRALFLGRLDLAEAIGTARASYTPARLI